MDHFRALLNYVETLYVVGYSFRDVHVNPVLRDWLGFTAHRTMVVVSPSATDLPNGFAHVASQVELRAETDLTFFRASDRDRSARVRTRPQTGACDFATFGRRAHEGGPSANGSAHTCPHAWSVHAATTLRRVPSDPQVSRHIDAVCSACSLQPHSHQHAASS